MRGNVKNYAIESSICKQISRQRELCKGGKELARRQTRNNAMTCKIVSVKGFDVSGSRSTTRTNYYHMLVPSCSLTTHDSRHRFRAPGTGNAALPLDSPRFEHRTGPEER